MATPCDVTGHPGHLGLVRGAMSWIPCWQIATWSLDGRAGVGENEVYAGGGAVICQPLSAIGRETLTALCSFKCTTSHPGPGAWPSAPGLPPSPSFPVLQIKAPNRETEGEGEAWGILETCHGLRLAGSKIGI